MSFLTFCALWLIPGWRDVLDRRRARDDRAACKDPAVRAEMLEDADDVAACGRLADFGRLPDRRRATPRRTSSTATARSATSPPRRGEDPFETIVDIVRQRRPASTVLWPHAAADDADADWELRRQLWEHARRAARRLRRRRPPRPHAGLALPDPLRRPTRLRGRQLVTARAGRAADDRRAGPAVRPTRAAAGSPRATTPTSSCSTPRRSDADAGPHRLRPAGREQAPAGRPHRRGAGARQRPRDRSSTASPPAPCRAPCCAPGATPPAPTPTSSRASRRRPASEPTPREVRP